ncbi:MAG: DUF3177 family protein [Coleofasciculaceae cyanobacterium SM2_1_6]|nr:DUF3177 family protein [Coleofasciculaceae cyanobacterium SM2_1_6]
MPETLLRSLVWTDYRLAVLFTVLLPLGLIIWAAVQRSEAIVRLLIIYWRVASLLLITVYLLMPGWGIGYITGFIARLLIPIALWFWVDLNEDIAEQPPSWLRLVTMGWRWAVTIYALVGNLISVPFLSCAFSSQTLSSPFCQVWLEPAAAYKNIFHGAYKPEFMAFWGGVGLFIYTTYLAYFVIVRLGKQGRSAIEQ